MYSSSAQHSSTYHYAEHERYNHPTTEGSPIAKMRSTYWTAKQLIRSRFGKPEDDHLVASDSELDSKLQVFYSIQDTCEGMLTCIEHYQDFICELSQDENALGRFLKQSGKKDQTQAGKMMSAVGRAETFTAQQRLALRVPLIRLYDELDVFTERAVADCQRTVESCERARTTYRGSLLWMKNISKELDPDTYRQMEKFRKVQASVRKNKAKFDKYKLDCLQKIDLLSASRANLFSNLMTNYQNCLLNFWERTTAAHETVSENFKGYQHYDFVVLKQLTEPSRRLAAITAGEPVDAAEGDAEEGTKSADNSKSDTSLIDLAAMGEINLITPNDTPVSALDQSQDLLGGLEDVAPVDDQFESLFAGGEWEATSKDKQPTDGGQSSSSAAVADQSAGGGTTTSQLIDAFLADADVQNEKSFAYQWQHQPTTSAQGGPSEQSSPARLSQSSKRIMPSQLMDLTAEPSGDSSKKSASKHDAWFNMFAELDPLKQMGDDGGAA